MSDESISVSEIDFPAVTVCPRLVLDYHKSWQYEPRIRYEKHTLIKYKYEFEEAAKEFADERRFGNISYVEFLNRMENGSIKPEELGDKIKVTKFFLCLDMYEAYRFGYNYSFVPYVIEVMKSESATWWFNEQYSSFNGKYLPQFSEVRTVRGMAYTFNLISSDEMFNFNHISSEFDYTNNITTGPENLQNLADSQQYPLMFNRSDHAELTIKLLKPQGDYARCIKQSFLIHHYDFIPTFASKYDFTSFEFGTIIDVIVTPEITRTDRSLKKLKPTERGCYFEGEKELHFFNTYSQKNCEIECVANFTLKTCGCVDFDQPFKTQEDICLNISRSIPTCVNNIQSEMYLSSDHLQQENCACLPLCDSISYNVKYYTMHEKEDNKYRSNW
ncbi:pickpocket protein 19-like [Chironomus tepperi]|uniref:pickpocket protein 19-like n=1 Tax=Chironomus tepperi TaxID=113505 RepID=UPI00391F485F